MFPLSHFSPFLLHLLIFTNRNHYEADPGATMTFVAGGALKPIGGHILSHSSATRMFLRKGKLTDIMTNAIFEASYAPISHTLSEWRNCR